MSNVQAGTQLPTVTHRPDESQLFLFSAATWNAHRIHYDREWARSEGHKDLVVQGTLQGAWMADLAVHWAQGIGHLKRFSFKNVGTAYLEQPLEVSGEVESVTEDDGGVCQAVCRLWVRTPDQMTARGSAVVVLADSKSITMKAGSYGGQRI